MKTIRHQFFQCRTDAQRLAGDILTNWDDCGSDRDTMIENLTDWMMRNNVIRIPKDQYDEMEENFEKPSIFDSITDDQMIEIVHGEELK